MSGRFHDASKTNSIPSANSKHSISQTVTAGGAFLTEPKQAKKKPLEKLAKLTPAPDAGRVILTSGPPGVAIVVI